MLYFPCSASVNPSCARYSSACFWTLTCIGQADLGFHVMYRIEFEFCVLGLNFAYPHEVFCFDNKFDLLRHCYEKLLQVLYLISNLTMYISTVMGSL